MRCKMGCIGVGRVISELESVKMNKLEERRTGGVDGMRWYIEEQAIRAMR